jgi:hypothetical protein
MSLADDRFGPNPKCRRAMEISGYRGGADELTSFQDPIPPCPDVLCFEPHGVVLRFLGRTT